MIRFDHLRRAHRNLSQACGPKGKEAVNDSSEHEAPSFDPGPRRRSGGGAAVVVSQQDDGDVSNRSAPLRGHTASSGWDGLIQPEVRRARLSAVHGRPTFARQPCPQPLGSRTTTSPSEIQPSILMATGEHSVAGDSALKALSSTSNLSFDKIMMATELSSQGGRVFSWLACFPIPLLIGHDSQGTCGASSAPCEAYLSSRARLRLGNAWGQDQ